MKLYTEEQVKFAILSAYLTGVTRPSSYEEAEEVLFNSLTPIELPSNEEIKKQSINIAHNYFDMHNTNHYQGLKEGSDRMAKWMKEKIINQNK